MKMKKMALKLASGKIVERQPADTKNLLLHLRQMRSNIDRAIHQLVKESA